MNFSLHSCLTTAKLIVLAFLLCFVSSWQKKSLSNTAFSRRSEIERIYEEWLEKANIYLISDTWQLSVDAINRHECKRNFREERRILCARDGIPYFYKIDLFLEQPSQEEDALRFWEDYNQQFHNTYGIELDDKLLFKASHLLGVPGYKVDIEIHTECSSRIIRMNAEYKIDHVVGEQCHMRHAQTSIPTGSLQRSLTTRIDATRLQTNLNNTGKKIIDFFKNRYNFSNNSDNWEWIHEDRNYISFSIKGLKNEVIRRENLWEKLQFSISLTERNNQLNLVLIMDGQIASGLGFMPPDRAYSDMEPEYSGELQDYTNNLIIQLKQSLTN